MLWVMSTSYGHRTRRNTCPSQVSEHPPCQTEACAIQTCLSWNSYNQEKCDGVLERLYAWCVPARHGRRPHPRSFGDVCARGYDRKAERSCSLMQLRRDVQAEPGQTRREP